MVEPQIDLVAARPGVRASDYVGRTRALEALTTYFPAGADGAHRHAPRLDLLDGGDGVRSRMRTRRPAGRTGKAERVRVGVQHRAGRVTPSTEVRRRAISRRTPSPSSHSVPRAERLPLVVTAFTFAREAGEWASCTQPFCWKSL